MTAAEVIAQVKTTVDERLVTFMRVFFKDSREATKGIADRIDSITDAVLGGCDERGVRSGATDVRMSTSRAALIDRARLSRPAVYATLRESASNVAFANPLAQRVALEAAMKAIQGAT
jgi:hypothetical protein